MEGVFKLTRGERIKQLMDDNRIDAQELADAIGKKRSYIYELIKGNIKKPSYEVMKGIADKFGVTEEYIETGIETLDRIYYTEPAIFDKLPEDLKEFVANEENTPFIVFAKQLTRYDIDKMLENIKDTDLKFLLDGLRKGIEKNKKDS